MKLLFLSIVLSLVSCSKENLQDKIVRFEMTRLDKLLTRNLGKNKFKDSFLNYLKDNTKIKLLEVNIEGTEAKIEILTLNKKIREEIMTMAMFGAVKKEQSLNDLFSILEKKDRKKVSLIKLNTLKGKCSLKQSNGSVEVINCNV